jgi:DNA-directed RNA polymerase specialized sigma24 family protein
LFNLLLANPGIFQPALIHRNLTYFLMSELADLLRAARKLDKDALTKIFDLYSPALYKFISRLVHDQCLRSDCGGGICATCGRAGRGQGPRTNIRSYLYQLAYRLVLERFGAGTHSPLEVSIRTQDKDKAAGSPDRRTG